MKETEEREDRRGTLERIRRALAWTAGFLFTISFSGLLVLSATTYWTPENRLVVLCDQVVRASGLAAIVLGLIPYAVAIGRRTLGLFSS